MKSILRKSTKSTIVLALLFSLFALSTSAQDFNPEVSFSLENTVADQTSTLSFVISQSEGESDIENSSITTNGGSFDFNSISVGDLIGSGSGFFTGGANSGEFTLVVSSFTASTADLDIMSDNEMIGAMQLSNTNDGVLIYCANTYEDGNNTTAGNSFQFELVGIFTNPMNNEITMTSFLSSELDQQSESSASFDLSAYFNPMLAVTLSSQEPSAFTDLTFDVSQDAGQEDISSVTFVFDGGSFALSSFNVGDVVGSGSGSFGGDFASGDYSIVVTEVTASTAMFNAVDGEDILAMFSVVNYADGGAEISSNAPADNNSTTAGNSNVFTLSNIFVNPSADVISMTASFISELQSSESMTFEYELLETVDFSPVLEVSFSNTDCDVANDLTFTISQDNGEIDMASSILTMTGGSFDFSASQVGDLVGTSSGFYAGDIAFNLSLFISEFTADGAVLLAVNDDDETQTSTFTLINLAEGVQITATSPGEFGEQNNTTAGNSTTVTLSNVFVNPAEGDYEFYGSFTSELNNFSEFGGGYSIVCPCDDVESSQEITLCPGETITVGENTYDLAGEYVDVFTLESGCDSTVTTTLAFFDVSTPTLSGEANVFENTAHDYTSDANAESTLEWGVVNGEITSGQGTSTVEITWGDGPSTGTVWLIETDENGCKADTAFLEVTISEVVGITENDIASVSVYPNPFKEFTTVEFNNSDNDIYRISLMDASGRIVMNASTQSNKFIIKKENLNEGIYFLEIDGKYKSRQIVVIQ